MEMALTQRTVRLVVAVMVVSLTGLIALQASLLADAFESREASFRRNVQAALGSVAEQLETAETVSATLTVVGDATEIVMATHLTRPDLCPPGSTEAAVAGNTRGPAQADIRYFARSDDPLVNILCDSPSILALPQKAHIERIDTILIDAQGNSSDSTLLLVRYSTDSTGTILHGHAKSDDSLTWSDLIDSSRMHIITRVIEQLTERQDIPISERVDATRLDSLVHSALDEYGIELEPVFGVVVESDSSLHLRQPDGYDDELRNSEFQTELFPNDILAAPASLSLYFPERGVYLFKQMGPMLTATVLFMLVVVFGFTYTVRTLLAQRRTSRQMVDFVNNMTHEFKTPISTVALACEAILRQDVISDADRVTRFSQMIQDENRRMRHQVEKILQMAALEETQNKLTLTAVDVHQVIRNAVQSVDLQVAKRGGRIECRLDSVHHVMPADEVHLTGIIYNLLDNANKYSPETPQITVATDDDNGCLRIVIEDRGLGLKPEDARRIFDKYFRVTHGNVHDVKGFGLGLSYVHLMVKAHGGDITVDSRPGLGTRMEVRFPHSSETELPPGEATA